MSIVLAACGGKIGRNARETPLPDRGHSLCTPYAGMILQFKAELLPLYIN
jgi:hypothetical protein